MVKLSISHRPFPLITWLVCDRLACVLILCMSDQYSLLQIITASPVLIYRNICFSFLFSMIDKSLFSSDFRSGAPMCGLFLAGPNFYVIIWNFFQNLAIFCFAPMNLTVFVYFFLGLLCSVFIIRCIYLIQ